MRLSENEWMPVWCSAPGQPFIKGAIEPSEAPAHMRRRLKAVGCGEERIGVRSVSRGSATSAHSGAVFIRITKLRRHGPETRLLHLLRAVL